MKNYVFWFTGLSGSGKTEIANRLKEFLNQEDKSVKILDGDQIRKNINKKLTFSPKDISQNNHSIAELCQKSILSYDFTLVPIISPFTKDRIYARELIGKNFYEIYVNAALEVCKERDTKGLYEKFEKREMKNLIGVDPNVPYEKPLNPDLELNTNLETVEESLSKFIDFIYNKKLL